MRKGLWLLAVIGTLALNACVCVLGNDIKKDRGAPLAPSDQSGIQAKDSGDLEFSKTGKGLILRAPNGKPFRVHAENDGRLSCTPLD